MKTASAALAIVLAGCAIGASMAQAAKPTTGTWKVKLDSAPTPPRGQKSGQQAQGQRHPAGPDHRQAQLRYGRREVEGV